MRLQLLFFSLLNIWALYAAELPSHIQTKHGVIIFTDPLLTGTFRAVKREVVSRTLFNYAKCDKQTMQEGKNNKYITKQIIVL